MIFPALSVSCSCFRGSSLGTRTGRDLRGEFRLLPQRIYRFRELKGAGVPFTRKHITHLEKQGRFPMHFRIGENSVGWLAEEVDHWLEERIRRRPVPIRRETRPRATR
jgi:predicted DNA-binding transcriptional regulator AlpA